ncbi:MAG: autotransporter-associated beta strand repeat-containing protein [Kiritimatiellae bacterium]|nr:autotransporter-associated beta strand repeat-containing protein [Kiritimatiellia bacterium]
MKERTRKSWLKPIVLAGAMALGLGAFAATYTWTGGGDDANWSTLANWSLEAGEVTAAPGTGDTAIFNTADAAVTLDSAVTIGTITANQAVAITGTGAMTLESKIDGEAVVTFNDVTITAGGSSVTISAPVDIPQDKTLTLHNAVGKSIHLSGKFTGKGQIVASSTGKTNNYSGVKFDGEGCDGSEFEGTVKIYSYLSGNNHQQRDSHLIAPSATSAKAVWRLNVDSVAPYCSDSLFNESGAYSLGAVQCDLMNKTTATNINFEVGALDQDSSFTVRNTGSNAGKFGSRNTIKWVAKTATLTLGATALQILDIAGGGNAVIASEAALPQRIKFSEDGGVLKTAADPSSVLTKSDVDIVYDDEGADHVWATALASSNEGGFEKRGAGTLTLAEIPAYKGATKVSAGTLVVPSGTTLKDLVVEDGAKVAIDLSTYGEGDSPTITLTGTTEATVEDFVFLNLREQYSAAITLEEGTVTMAVSANTDTVKWTGAAGDNAWGNVANWAVGDTVATSLPDVTKTVVFPANTGDDEYWDVELVSMQTVSNIVAVGNVKFSGAKIKVWNRTVEEVTTSAVSGSGLVILGDNSGFTTDGTSKQTITVENPIRVDASKEAPAQFLGQWANSGSTGLTLKLLGNMSGSGALEVKGQRLSWAVENDWSNYSGSVFVYDDYERLGSNRRNSVAFKSTKATNANMTWTPNNSNSLFEIGSSTFYFKALNGYVTLSTTQTNYQHNRLVVGNDDDEDSELTGNFFANSYAGLIEDRGATLQKVGSSTLTFSGKRLTGYEIDDGVLELTADTSVRVPYKPGGNSTTECEIDDPDLSGIARPTITFKGGTLKLADTVTADPSEGFVFTAGKLAVVDDGGVDRTFATAVGNSKTSGFTKKGAGTLTLTETPTYTGVTRVDEGALIVPASFEYTLGQGTYVDTSYEEEGYVKLVHGNSVKVDETEYDTINAALEAAEDGATVTVTLLTDSVEDVVIPAGKTLNIDQGEYTFAGTVTGAGTLNVGDGVRIVLSSMNALDGLTALAGTGTLVMDGKGTGTVASDASANLKTLLKNAAWQGVFEFKDCYQISPVYWMGDFGNSGSTLRYSGTCATYLNNTSYSDGAHNVGTLDIANGATLKINGTYGSAQNFVITSAFTGAGKLTIGIAGNNNKNVQFTGDVSGFTGSIDWASDTANTRLVFGSTSKDFVAKSLVVGEGAEVTIGSGSTWMFKGGAIVDGKLTIVDSTAEMLCKYSPNYLRGSGTIVFAGGAVKSTGNFGYHSTDWTGTTILGFTPASGSSSPFNTYGTANSSVGTSAAFTGHLGGNFSMVPALNLVSDFTFNNGSSTETAWESGKVTALSGITGKNNLNFTWVNPNAGRYAYYTIGTIDADGFEGTISVANKNALAIGAVAFAAAPAKETCLVKMSVAEGGKIYNIDGETKNEVAVGSILTTATVAGAASETKLMLGADGIYVAVASIGSTYYSSLQAAGEAALAADDHVFTVIDGTTSLPGWEYDSDAKTFTKVDVAQVGETKYLTLASAIATGTTDDIVLIADCAETVTLGEGQTIKPGTYAFSGVLKGAGTIYYAAKPTTVPTFEDWTGTFVADWEGAQGTPFPANDYGIEGSVVEVRKLAGGYVPIPGTENVDRTILPTVSIPEECTMKLNNGYSSTITTFTKLTGSGTLTIEGYTCYFNTLDNFTGTITAATNLNCKIVDIVTSATIAPGTCLVKGGTFTDVADTTVNGEAPSVALKVVTTGDDAGIYFAPVALIGTSYYNTLQEAVTAASATSSTKVLLVASTEGETATIPAPAAGGNVMFYIAANGNTLGTVNAPDGDYILTTATETVAIDSTDYEATKYQLVEAAAAVTVNDTRTLYGAAQMQQAVNAAIAGGLGATIEFVNGTDGSAYAAILTASGFTEENGVWTFTTSPVAKVTHGVIETSYLTLAAAIDNAQSGDTVKLVADVDVISTGLTFPAEKTVTFDLNGYTLTAGNGATSHVQVNGVVTITDSSEGAEGQIVSAEVGNYGLVQVAESNTQEGAALTIAGGTIEAYFPDTLNDDNQHPAYGVAIKGKDTVFNMTGGKVKAGLMAIMGHGSKASGGTYTISGGTIESVDDFAMYLPTKGGCSVTISGGTFVGQGAVSARAGTVTVTGGTFTASGDGVAPGSNPGTTGLGFMALAVTPNYAAVEVAVSGGVFTSATGVAAVGLVESTNAGSISLTGGTYSTDPSDYVASGYEATEDDGVWVVGEVTTTPIEPGVETPFDTAEDAANVTFKAPAAVEAEDKVDPTAYRALFKDEPTVIEKDGKFYSTYELKDTVVEAIVGAVAEPFDGDGTADLDIGALATNDKEVTVAAKPGLYYGVYTTGSLSTAFTASSCVMATGNTVALTFPKGGTTQFYKVFVSVTPVDVPQE